MKFIYHVQGTAAVRVSSDDVVPEAGFLQRDLIQFVAGMYNFGNRPVLPPNLPPQAYPSNLTFQQGQYTDENGTFPIQALSIFPNGDSVSAANTDVADKILNNYMERLDSEFSYRYGGKPQKRLYLSNIVVEFDRGLAEYFSSLTKIRELLSTSMPARESSDLKSVVFGHGNPQSGEMATLDDFENSDFKIERRADEPYDRNRYFSSAPMRTAEHFRVLEQIEKILRG